MNLLPKASNKGENSLHGALSPDMYSVMPSESETCVSVY